VKQCARSAFGIKFCVGHLGFLNVNMEHFLNYEVVLLDAWELCDEDQATMDYQSSSEHFLQTTCFPWLCGFILLVLCKQQLVPEARTLLQKMLI
jgi:hypothetical protein